ncbi:MAG TPA: hypothetical protein VF070_31510 [Streptosporangiaceae bacterium]
MQAAADAGTRKIPAADSRRRSQLVVTTALAVALILLIVPALIVRPIRDPAPLGFSLGLVIGLGLDCLRHVSNARGRKRLLSPGYRYLTAPTWTGMRTIDLRDVRSVRARRVAGRGSSTTYVVVLDGEGVRMSFSDKKDIERISRAVTRQLAREDAPPVRVSRFAAATLGLRPLPPGVSALWSLGSVEAVLMAALAATFTIIAIAGS